ncbi:DUF523 and DUF1722 domain-containing protein [Pleionea sp. CnH1-48]|uniref:YbgA family protein n=1 Tax=Pleionea sp. CnH1-48 TaxID=2954494 RepID=UPI002096A097|nr:DUF523 and DUF1722 domain-containing protein [Pleionea sp. CnH1-48]MCO7224906.1 DUF523 and DUF1722 domain-containing protein [Pleionea sp. CnH1-48]
MSNDTSIPIAFHQANTPDHPIENKVKVGLSACLAGLDVRYNGGHSRSKICNNRLQNYFSFTTFCPEVAAGFGTPRPTMRLIGDPQNPTLTYSDDSHADLTAQLTAGFQDKLESFASLDGYILMKNSPSCGMNRIKVYQENGYPHPEKGRGIFAAALRERYPLLPIEEEGRLNDAKLFENFVLRVYAHHYFRHEVLKAPSFTALINFHSRYKYVVMAHSQQSYRKLGRLLANGKQYSLDDLIPTYQTLLMTSLSRPASSKNHTNTLMHIAGYLKKTVPSKARQHIALIIERYRKGELPLVTPLTLLKHYIDQSDNLYLRQQRYLAPYPEELGLNNRL